MRTGILTAMLYLAMSAARCGGAESAEPIRTAVNREQGSELTYERLLRANPPDIVALSNLAVTRFRAGKIRKAEDALLRVLAVEPQDSFALRTLGIIYYQQARYDESIARLKAALSVNPADRTARSCLKMIEAQKTENVKAPEGKQ